MEEKNDLVEVPEVDVFTIYTKKAVKFINENRNSVILGVAAFFGALLIISCLPAWMQKKEAAGFLELQKSVRTMAVNKSESDKKAEEIFKPVMEKFKGSNADGFANLYLARNLFDSGKTEESGVYYKNAENILGKKELFGEVINYELGCANFDRNPDKAKEYFENLVASKSFLEEEALFYLAISGDKKSLESLDTDYSDGFYSEIVKEKLALLNKKN